MKRVIFIEILLIFILSFLLVATISYWKNVEFLVNYYNNHLQDTVSWNDFVSAYGFDNNLTYSIISLIAVLANLIAIILITTKNFPVFKPLVDKYNARKQKHAQAKAERAEIEKQKRIEQLETELEELKKDE